MAETNITRRRAMQGAGAIGIASLGTTIISAQEGGGGAQDGQSAAIRVANASPDAPNLDVRLKSTGGAGTPSDGNATGTGNQTNETDGQGGGGGDDGPEIGGIGFRAVSGYNEVAPGSYRMQIVPAEGGILGDFIEDIFGGGNEDEKTVLFDGEIEVEEGTTYTVVAFGELARGPIPAEDAEVVGNETDGGTGTNETDVGTSANETDTGVGQNETNGTGGDGTTVGGEELVSDLAFGDHETVDLDAGNYTLEFREAGAAGMAGATDDGATGNETNGAGASANETDATTDGGTLGQTGDAQRGFQVKVLEDDITGPGEGQSRVRIFHAVPDVDTMSISQVSKETPSGAGGNGTPGDAGGTGTPGDTGGTSTPGGAGGTDTPGGAGSPQQEEGVRQTQISPAGNTVYSGFALGYFDPQAAASAGDQGGDGNMTGDGNATGDGNMTGDGNATGQGEDVAKDAGGEEFEFVTVKDAQGGERSDGGTGGFP